MRLTRTMRGSTAVYATLLSVILGAGTAAAGDAYDTAVTNAARPAGDHKRDAIDHPADMLRLAGIKPGGRVADILGGDGYYSELASYVVGPKGHVYMYDLPYTEAFAGAKSRDFVTAHPNSTYELVDYNKVELPKNVDIVFNVLYYHDLPLNNIDTASLNKRIFEALKPGGIFFIVDHNAAPGSGTRDTKALHRIDPEVIKKEVTAAGFELVTESKLLANPDDDHTKMVFTPGTRRHTDQSVFKFRKPKK